MPESKALLRAIFDAEIDGIVTTTTHGTIESANCSMEKLFRYTRSELLGQNLRLLMPAALQVQPESYRSCSNITDQTESITRRQEVVGKRKDGSTFPLEWSAAEVRLGERSLL